MRKERYEIRDRAYGAWHRAPSISRYLHVGQAESLTMVDLDSVLFAEYDNAGKVPLALVEVARDIGQEKPAGVMQQLARLADALEKQNEDIGKLQTKLADAKAREKVMVARHKSASARLKVRTKLYDERIADAFARFEQVERTLDEMEGRVEALDLGRKKGLADELAGLEAESNVEEELAALKARLGNSIRPEPAK